MKAMLLDILRCPNCGGVLGLLAEDEVNDEIIAGLLRCEDCDVAYPITNGIPRFVDASSYADSFGLQWNAFRREQIDNFNGTDISAARVLSETSNTPDSLAGKVVLDVGCGAGRFIDAVAPHGCRVVGVDLSSAIDAARDNLSQYPNVDLVQADIYRLPFVDGCFDLCYCIGVIQHTPRPQAALRALPRVIKDGGTVAVTMYERRRFTRFYPKYLLRRVTTRLRQESLLRAIRFMMPIAFPLSEILFRIPLLGRIFRFALPIANYVQEGRLDYRQRYRWAILDTFDMLAPAWDQPLVEEEVRHALRASGVLDMRRLPNSGLNLLGRKGSR